MSDRGAILAGLAAGMWASLAAAQQPPAPAAADPSLLPYANPQEGVRLPDGRAIHLVCRGQGAPVVILTAGAGEWSLAWNRVQPAVARKTRVCAWDRAGLGFSTPTSKLQSVADTTSDLQAALKAARIDGPYVVVGHSLGGFESLLLKDREPSKIVGMVLVDPSFPDQLGVLGRVAPAFTAWMQSDRNPLVPLLRKCAAALRAGTLRYGGPDPDGCLHPPWPASYPAELRAALDRKTAEASPASIASAMDTTAFYMSGDVVQTDDRLVVRPGRNYGAMPLIVLTAGDFMRMPPDAPPDATAQFPLVRTAWTRGHDAYAALSTRGVNRLVEGSPHAIQQARPQVVIDAIDEVVDAARADLAKGR